MLSSGWRTCAAVSPISPCPANRTTWDDSRTHTPTIDADTEPCAKPSLSLHEQVEQGLEDIEPTNAEKLLADQLSRHDRQLRARLKAWSTSVDDLLKSEYQRFRTQSDKRLREFQLEAESLLRRLASRNIRYADATRALTALKEEKERENHDIFVPYIAALGKPAGQYRHRTPGHLRHARGW